MANYIGETCRSCGAPFQEGDDIVVCPDCGTPYHRSCYEKNGRCINTALHQSGRSWTEERQARTASQPETIFCPRCAASNPAGSSRCRVCGQDLRSQSAAVPGSGGQQTERQQDGSPIFMAFSGEDRCCGLDPDEDLGGERLGDVADFVNTNTLYYLPLFKRFYKTGSKFSLNLICLFFPELYFAHRKMWRTTLLLLLLMVLLSIPSMVLSFLSYSATLIQTLEQALSEQQASVMIDSIQQICTKLEARATLLSNLSVICQTANTILNLLCCLFGNFLYYRFVLRRVRAIKSMPHGYSELPVLLRASGGTRFANVILVILILCGLSALLALGFVAFLL